MKIHYTSSNIWIAAGIAACLAACSDDPAPETTPLTTAGESAGGAGAPTAGGGTGAAGTPAANGGAGSVAQPPVGRGGDAAPAPAGTGMPSAGRSAGRPPAAAAGSGAAPEPETPPGNPPKPSAGCGKADGPMSGAQTMDVDGTMREYISRIPMNYDANKPYRLIFAWHGLGGTAMQVASGFGGGWYGLSNRAMDSAIFISGQGLPTSSGGMTGGGAGWPNTGGRDVAFVRKLVDWAKTNYCIDESRIFSTGMSYGGIMSNTLGCQMGDVFRAIAPMSGSGPLAFGRSMCVGQVAAWISHGNTDTVVQFSAGQASRDHWAMTNHCTMETTPVGPDMCVSYNGCDAGFPVVWCEFAGGHMPPSFSGAEIWKFFSQF